MPAQLPELVPTGSLELSWAPGNTSRLAGAQGSTWEATQAVTDKGVPCLPVPGDTSSWLRWRWAWAMTVGTSEQAPASVQRLAPVLTQPFRGRVCQEDQHGDKPGCLPAPQRRSTPDPGWHPARGTEAMGSPARCAPKGDTGPNAVSALPWGVGTPGALFPAPKSPLGLCTLRKWPLSVF